MIRALLLILTLVSVVAVLAAGWLWQDYQRYLATPLSVGDTPLSFTVEPGANLRAVADDLAAAGILDKPLYLVLEARRQGLAARIQAGEYRLTAAMTPLELLEMLVAGRVVQHALTLVEGWTFRQVLDAVHSHPVLVPTLQGLADDAIMERLGRSGEHPEGRFFPETYHFTRGTTDEQFLRRALETMDRILAAAWEDRQPDLPYADPYEALIMASIIERETGIPEERRTVAGVFVRRLRIGMRLQTDPTVIYGLGEDFQGRLTRENLRTDTPYNTYTRDGLTPTPIAMPGRAAIEAALNPADGKALYFVSRGDGSHHFSATLEEHNQAVAYYQLGRGTPPESRID